MKKVLLIGAAVAAVLIAVVVILLLSQSSKKPAPEVLPSSSPSVSPTASPAGNAVEIDGEDIKSFGSKQQEVSDNPLLQKIPTANVHWALTFDGIQEKKYLVKATVFYGPKEKPQSKIDQQRPFIERFITDTGQPAGTYTVEYLSRLVERD